VRFINPARGSWSENGSTAAKKFSTLAGVIAVGDGVLFSLPNVPENIRKKGGFFYNIFHSTHG
jgi:hypothetical protein